MSVHVSDPCLEKGIISNIQRFSIHDGPGIRTTVFLKGCPLRCEWCSNPETQDSEPVIMFPSKGCVMCGRCKSVCPLGAIRKEDGHMQWTAGKCDFCGRCLSVCPSRLPRLCGEKMSVGQVLGIVLRDMPFYKASLRSGDCRSGSEGANSVSGGITLSGGEPLKQAAFSLALLREAKKAGISTCIETTLCCPFPVIEEAASFLDWIYCDLKHADPEKHRKLTGADNALILSNMQKLTRIRPDLHIRVPVIPGFNDDAIDIDAIASQLLEWNVEEAELMRYHNLGVPKYRALGKPYRFQAVKQYTDAAFEEICERYRKNGLRLV